MLTTPNQPASGPVLSTPDEREVASRQLDRVHTARAGTDQVVWTVASVFTAAMAILIDTTLTLTGSGRYVAALAVSLIALFIGVIWTVTLERALLWLGFHEALTMRIEADLLIRPEHSLSPRNPDLKALVPDGPRAKPALRMLARAATGWWFFFALYCLMRALTAAAVNAKI